MSAFGGKADMVWCFGCNGKLLISSSALFRPVAAVSDRAQI